MEFFYKNLHHAEKAIKKGDKDRAIKILNHHHKELTELINDADFLKLKLEQLPKDITYSKMLLNDNKPEDCMKLMKKTIQQMRQIESLCDKIAKQMKKEFDIFVH